MADVCSTADAESTALWPAEVYADLKPFVFFNDYKTSVIATIEDSEADQPLFDFANLIETTDVVFSNSVESIASRQITAAYCQAILCRVTLRAHKTANRTVTEESRYAKSIDATENLIDYLESFIRETFFLF